MFKTSVIVVGARIAGALLAIGTQVLLARLAGAEALGIYYVALALVALLSMLSTLGLPWVLPTVVAEAEKSGQPARSIVFFNWARRDVTIASVLFAGISALVVAFAPFVPEELRAPLLIGVLAVPWTTLMRINGAMANARKRFALAYLPELIARPALVFAAAVLLTATTSSVAVWVLLTANIVFTGALAGVQTYVLHRGNDVPRESIVQIKSSDVERHAYSDHRRSALPMITATLFIAIFADLDVLMVGFFLVPKDLAVFTAALKITMFLAFFIQSAHQIIMRDTAEAFGRSDQEALKRIVARTNMQNILVSVAAFVGVILFGRIILGVFGAEFDAGYFALLVLVGSQAVRAAAGPGIQLLTLSGNTKKGSPVFITSTIVLLVSNALFIPLFGVLGAALAVFVTTTVWTGWISILAVRHTGVASFWVPRRLQA